MVDDILGLKCRLWLNYLLPLTLKGVQSNTSGYRQVRGHTFIRSEDPTNTLTASNGVKKHSGLLDILHYY